jgi:hypothetical protein
MNILIWSNIPNLISLLSVSYLLLNLQYPYQNYFTMIQVEKYPYTSFSTNFSVTVNQWYDTSGIQFAMLNGLYFQYIYFESIQINVYPIDNYTLEIQVYVQWIYGGGILYDISFVVFAMSNSKVYNPNSNDLINFQYGGFGLYSYQTVYNNSNWNFEIESINTFIGLYGLSITND